MGKAGSVGNGAEYNKWVGDAMGNSKELFEYQGMTVTNFRGKRFVVTEVPALTDTTAAYKVLVLNQGGITVENQGAPVTIMSEKTGDNITIEYQADFSFDLGLKMFAYKGTANPTAVELASGAHWTAVYASAKNGVGALLVSY